MKNINKKSINYGLKILTILAFVLIFIPFNRASAYTTSYTTSCGEGGCNTSWSGTNSVPNSITNITYGVNPYQQFAYVPPTTTTVNTTSTNPNKQTTRVITRTNPSTPSQNTSTPATTTTPNTTDNNSNLASNAIFGTNGFLPSGLVQWILFAIFILIIVILARRIFGAQERYEEEPLKHA